MSTATLIIACLLSASLGVGAAVLTSLVRRSLEVRAADLTQLSSRISVVENDMTTAVSFIRKIHDRLAAIEEQQRLQELDLSTLAVRAGVRRAA